MSFLDSRQRVREAAVPENYRPRNGGEIGAGEELRCYVCGFFTRQSGTLAYAWEHRNPDIAPSTIDLCEFCHQAASEIGRAS